MAKVYVTVIRVNDFQGTKPFKIGGVVKFIKEPDNKKDSEAIKAVIPKVGTVGYVANGGGLSSKGTYSAGRIYDTFNRKTYGKIVFILDDSVIVKLDKTKKQKIKKKYKKASLKGIIPEGEYPNLKKYQRRIFSFYKDTGNSKNYVPVSFPMDDYEQLPFEQLKAAVDGYYGKSKKSAGRLGLFTAQINNLIRQAESAIICGDANLAKNKLAVIKNVMSCMSDSLAVVDWETNADSVNNVYEILESYNDYNQKQN